LSSLRVESGELRKAKAIGLVSTARWCVTGMRLTKIDGSVASRSKRGRRKREENGGARFGLSPFALIPFFDSGG